MEKICIVKLRKKLNDRLSSHKEDGPAVCKTESGDSDSPSGTDKCSLDVEAADGQGAQDKSEAGCEKISLRLTGEQVKAMKDNPYAMSLLSSKFIARSEKNDYSEKPLIVEFVFEPVSHARLLLPVEVCQMLRISKHFLGALVREGKLSSYKVGSMRRFMLADILSYLEENRELPCTQQPVLNTKTANNEAS